MLLYVLADTPDDRHVYRLGEHDDTGTDVVAALLDGIRKSLKWPAGDEVVAHDERGNPITTDHPASPWRLHLMVDAPHPDATAGAEFHDLTPDL